MKKLYRYEMDCGRAGTVEGLFTADDAEVAAAIGKDVQFGEILGKHSEVAGTLDASEFEELTDDAAFIAKFEEFHCASGYNPLDYINGDA